MKKTLLLIIDNLKKGGAEILLTGILPDLNNNFEVILITLSAECDFREDEILCKKKYSLGFKNKFDVIVCIWKLKKIIKKHHPALIHSHLFYSSLIARIASPSHIPLLYSLHGEMSKNVFTNSKLFTFLEKKTVKKNHSIIAVSNLVLNDYEKTIRKNTSSFVLPNYISSEYFQKKNQKKNINVQHLKLIAVGNFKRVKNYIYLTEAFEKLVEYDICLDIVGKKNEEELKPLMDKILKKNLKIVFKGEAENIHELLPAYDLYVSCSLHEGFGIAAIEAMASGLPLLLSDIPVFHEVTFNNVLFFDLKNTTSFSDLIKEIIEDKHNLYNFSVSGIELAKKYRKENYLNQLFAIYKKCMD